jgi:hypothetical protein
VDRWWEDKEYGTVWKGGSEKEPEDYLGPEAWFPLDGPRENSVLIGRLEEDPASHSLTQLLESCFCSYSLLSRTIEGWTRLCVPHSSPRTVNLQLHETKLMESTWRTTIFPFIRQVLGTSQCLNKETPLLLP